jgi:hypothetical protein
MLEFKREKGNPDVVSGAKDLRTLHESIETGVFTNTFEKL